MLRECSKDGNEEKKKQKNRTRRGFVVRTPDAKREKRKKEEDCGFMVNPSSSRDEITGWGFGRDKSCLKILQRFFYIKNSAFNIAFFKIWPKF